MVADGDTVKRKIRELRVVELRNELESRGLDKAGVKAVLVDRLTKALQDEGENPEEYLFDTTEKRAIKRNSIGKLEHDCISNPDSTADLADITNIQEVEEELKEDSEKNETIKKEFGTEEKEEEAEPEDETMETAHLPSESLKTDTGSNHENNDVVEDCINLNLEDEENFDEEENNSKEKDESPTQRRGIVQHEEKIKTASSGVGPGQATTAKDNMEVKISSTASTSNGDEEHGTTIEEKESKSTTLDTSITTLSSGDKAKSGIPAIKDGTKNAIKDDKDKKKTVGSSTNNRSSRNLWVSGLSSTTKATDLKHLFSKHGKVIGAKVVTNARSPGAKCFGYVTMATIEEASKCIQHLHHTELHGRIISVERAKGESGPKKTDGKSDSALPSESNIPELKANDKIDDIETVSKADAEEKEVSLSGVGYSSITSPTGSSKEKDEGQALTKDEKDAKMQQQRNKSRDRTEKRDRHRRPPSPHRPRQAVLTFHHIREERERQRQREREREEREMERRRRDEVNRLREHERRQREEAIRLEKDRERLRMDREKFEREKAELLRMERERQRMEREKLEREREEFRKQARSLVQIEEARRAVKRPAPSDRDEYFSERKRLSVESSLRYESQPPPRFDPPKSKTYVEFRSSKSIEANRGYDNRNRYERPAPTGPPPASITRRVVQEIANTRRDGRPTPPSPPHRERDDRRVVERIRDDRFSRSNRGNVGRETFPDRERDRERPREREPVRNRLDRDHHERYSDSRTKGSDMRSFNDRSSDSWRSGGGVASGSSLGGTSKGSYGGSGGGNMGNILGNGGAVPHLTPRESHHVWGAANERKTEASMNSSSGGSGSSSGGGGAGNSSAWSGQNASTDRWNSSLMPIGRSMGGTPGGFNSNWSGSAGPLNSNVYNSAAGSLGSLNNGVLGQSGSGNYSADRYSRH